MYEWYIWFICISSCISISGDMVICISGVYGVYVSVLVVICISGVYGSYVSVVVCINDVYIWCICISGVYGLYVSVGQREATLKRHGPDWLLAMEEACTNLAHIKL